MEAAPELLAGVTAISWTPAPSRCVTIGYFRKNG